MKASLYLNKLKDLKYEDLIELEGFGPIIAKNILDYVSNPEFHKLVSDFETLEQLNKGLEVELTINQGVDNYRGIVCITGKFDISRTIIAEQLERAGYKVNTSITKDIDFLVVGDAAGSKLAKANKLGVNIVYDYNDLLVD
jgi:DNA ligase (NAD+)